MKRRLCAVLTSSVLVLSTAVACDDEAEGPCSVDTDCPEGMLCREARCGPVGAEAGASVEAGAPVCDGDGLTCSVPATCCSQRCVLGRCGGAEPVTSCRGLYELCADDCCAGLTCTSGTCR
ncbi:MAG: hypothetical protein KF894_15230 [Labilithrix sp.]|nr:hypothetical protein [Labilithrix sp.]